MKEEPDDQVVFGFKAPEDGWHIAKFQSGIDYLPPKGGGDGFWQDDKGNKALKLPCLVDDPEDTSNEGQISVLLNCGTDQKRMASILRVVGLWDAVVKRYPGKDVTVFDAPVVEGIKVKLPGTTCMIKTELDKNNNARPRLIVSFAKYKEIIAAEKAKAVGDKKSGKAGVSPETAKASAEEEANTRDW